MARDIVKSFAEEPVAQKTSIGLLLGALIAHFFPWVEVTGALNATAIGFQTWYGIGSGVLLGIALLLVLLTLAAEFSAVGRKNARVVALICVLVAVVCQIVLYFQFGEQKSAMALLETFRLKSSPMWGLYVASVLSVSGLVFGFMSLRGR
jgi:hypothetical protein